MHALSGMIETGSRAVSYLLGGVTLLLAILVATTSMSTAEIATEAEALFGPTFILLMTGLVLTALYCLVRITQAPQDKVFLEAGLQAANGVTTLALTYTLFGISLGIGTLADQVLTPETVQDVIRELTGKFSLAFMTTVVGLPVAAILRALLCVAHARGQSVLRGAVNDNESSF